MHVIHINIGGVHAHCHCCTQTGIGSVNDVALWAVVGIFNATSSWSTMNACAIVCVWLYSDNKNDNYNNNMKANTWIIMINKLN